MADKKRTVDMTKGKPGRLILTFALPLFIGNIFQMLYNMVDAVVVGRFVGPQALAAVGGASSSYNLTLALVLGFTNGGSVLLAQAFGNGDRVKIRKCYYSAFILIMVSAVFLSGIGIILARPLLEILHTPADVIADSTVYLRWMAAGILATALYNSMAAFLRAVGNSRTPLIALVVASCTNIVLDLVFVIVFHMGVMGVAVATVMSQALSGFYCLVYVNLNIPELKIRLKEIEFDPAVAKETLRIGLPAALSTVVVTMSVMFIQRAVNGYGSTVMAAYTTANKSENICFALSYATGMATGVFCGQNMGAGRLDRVREGLFTGIKISLIYHLVMAVVLFSCGKYIVGLFTTDPDVISIGSGIVRITACFAPVLGILFIFQHFLRSVSDVRPTIYMSGAEIFSRGLLPYVLASRFGYYGIWWATPIGWSLSLLIGILRYRSGKWKAYVKSEQTEAA